MDAGHSVAGTFSRCEWPRRGGTTRIDGSSRWGVPIRGAEIAELLSLNGGGAYTYIWPTV